MTFAPIALFAFNRPGHLARTLAALAENPGASGSHLIIFCDGSRSSQEQERVDAVRRIATSACGFRSVTLRTRAENAGLRTSIVEGVTRLLTENERVIVLEDDMVTSPFFLGYMNGALDRFRDFPQVMHIAGYMWPIAANGLPDAFFLRCSSCWGWATWSRAWRHFRVGRDPDANPPSRREIHAFNLDSSFDYWSMLRNDEAGRIRTWAVWWYWSVFRQNGLCLHPRESLVRQEGLDGSGTHCISGQESASLLAGEALAVPELGAAGPFEDIRALAGLRAHHLAHRPRALRRLWNAVRARR